MFGYVMPLQSEMRVREFKLYNACYCGLCHTLGKKYGVMARLILSYDFNFLAMLLWGENEPVKTRRRRCPVNPLRKKQCCDNSPALDKCAGYSVILAWWKLRDCVADEPFIKSLPQRLLSRLLRGAYKKASRELYVFDAIVRDNLSSLAALEAERNPSIDAAADKFASLLAAAVPDDLPDGNSRTLNQILYHVGRWIYIVDALDDLTDDVRGNRYNPIAARFGGAPNDNEKQRVETTLRHSAGLAAAAFELMPENPWTETVRNTLYLGLPEVTDEVLDGSWKKHKRSLKMM